jgi:hypothetical protein
MLGVVTKKAIERKKKHFQQQEVCHKMLSTQRCSTFLFVIIIIILMVLLEGGALDFVLLWKWWRGKEDTVNVSLFFQHRIQHSVRG